MVELCFCLKRSKIRPALPAPGLEVVGGGGAKAIYALLEGKSPEQHALVENAIISPGKPDPTLAIIDDMRPSNAHPVVLAAQFQLSDQVVMNSSNEGIAKPESADAAFYLQVYLSGLSTRLRCDLRQAVAETQTTCTKGVVLAELREPEATRRQGRDHSNQYALLKQTKEIMGRSIGR